jgi:hypothetical protein
MRYNRPRDKYKTSGLLRRGIGAKPRLKKGSKYGQERRGKNSIRGKRVDQEMGIASVIRL